MLVVVVLGQQSTPEFLQDSRPPSALPDSRQPTPSAAHACDLLVSLLEMPAVNSLYSHWAKPPTNDVAKAKRQMCMAQPPSVKCGILAKNFAGARRFVDALSQLHKKERSSQQVGFYSQNRNPLANLQDIHASSKVVLGASFDCAYFEMVLAERPAEEIKQTCLNGEGGTA